MTSRIIFDGFHCMVYNWDPETLKFNPESSELLSSLNTLGVAVGERFLMPYPILWKIPTKKNKKYAKAWRITRSFIEKFLSEQKEKFQNQKEEILLMKKRSLLQEMLIANESEDESKRLTNDELIDQVATLSFAGYDTTSNVTCICLNFLARNMSVQDHLRSIIIEAFPNGEEDILQAGIEGIEKISYLSHFVNEVHRICPLTFISRDCIRDTEINGYPIKKGEEVMIDNNGIGQREDFWNNMKDLEVFPIKKGEEVMIDNNGIGQREDFWNNMKDLEVFRPERWAEHKPALFEGGVPFGFGARVCPGKRLATYEIKVLLCVALLKHRIVLRNPNEKFELTTNLGVNLKGGDVNYIRI
eukprot:CAMPEP_0170537440 /NCGR_PEP_ID=MMETSP0209-20121228/102715_1 /TAXON_ID=665100 ORGANISM="Litonotus pictus, Strain P1" /NCGR_SAMPLE_ID=MMETSP0209 /ASSEMBLY_ACC=CAM_ASM_000301 /LENGTH=357 /DNA_ID=CAMNT_0010838939 /DNA_START=507 /DNA_END=1581 /DNA_ORIENTATION=-